MVMGSLRQETDVVVVGSGPGGYVAALRAADLGRQVILVEERDRLGGVCLTEGCIPSKALIGAVELAQSARDAVSMGLHFSDLRVDVRELRSWTDGVVEGLTAGIGGLLRRRGVEVISGRARLEGDRALAVEGGEVYGCGGAEATSNRARSCSKRAAGSPRLASAWRRAWVLRTCL